MGDPFLLLRQLDPDQQSKLLRAIKGHVLAASSLDEFEERLGDWRFFFRDASFAALVGFREISFGGRKLDLVFPRGFEWLPDSDLLRLLEIAKDPDGDVADHHRFAETIGASGVTTHVLAFDTTRLLLELKFDVHRDDWNFEYVSRWVPRERISPLFFTAQRHVISTSLRREAEKRGLL